MSDTPTPESLPASFRDPSNLAVVLDDFCSYISLNPAGMQTTLELG